MRLFRTLSATCFLISEQITLLNLFVLVNQQQPESSESSLIPK